MSSKPHVYSVYADDPLYVALVKERDELRAQLQAADRNYQASTAELLAEVERLKRDNLLAVNELVEYARLLAREQTAKALRTA